ncbi:SGNH/GDSL hydrolase family protein [Luteipulveratus halotolerans]|uniref:G-D-S-L family lipolytic protein n=1 Tax=Luteipulveratus halotolerans TaxID=1631356 RepID=A0A0L6CKW5_9MICO|nr:SGNH/GDSL hydrolase family protein [Luteipulveratus halotolerans]KNX38163.1 G-D-S-L family lipolytic protein [Luteipulveratus halotolerans]
MTRVWERYVAIGDSFTEGMSDPSPTTPDVYVGWADRLAAQLGARNALQDKPFGYANLAIRGRLVADVVGPQTDAALDLQPDLVSIVGGANDCLRPKVDLDDVAAQLEAAVVRLRAAGADVLLSTTADPGWAPVLKHVRPRLSVHTNNLWAIAQRHGCYVIDMWTLRSLRDTRMWAQDRIHLSTLGHERVAAQAAWTLGLPAGDLDWKTPLPAAAPLSRREAAGSHAAWVRTHLSPWVQRRLQGRSSGDGRAPKRPTVSPVDSI